MKKMIGYIGLILLSYSLLQVIALSVLCGLDTIEYSGQHHFIGFLDAQGLECFFIAAVFFFFIGIICALISCLETTKRKRN